MSLPVAIAQPLNQFVAWLYAHATFAQGNPYLLAAAVAVGGVVAAKIVGRVWLLSAAVWCATALVVGRLVGLSW